MTGRASNFWFPLGPTFFRGKLVDWTSGGWNPSWRNFGPGPIHDQESFRLGEHVFFGKIYSHHAKRWHCQRDFFFWGGNIFVENLPSFWGSKPTLLPKFVAGFESGWFYLIWLRGLWREIPLDELSNEKPGPLPRLSCLVKTGDYDYTCYHP